MAMEFATVQRFDGEVPCLKLSDGELAPISLTEFYGDGAFSPYGFGSWPDLWWDRKFSFRGPYEMLRRSGPQEDGIVLTDVRKTEHGIQRSLHEFLSYRFAGMNRWAEWYKAESAWFSSGISQVPAQLPGCSVWWPSLRRICRVFPTV